MGIEELKKQFPLDKPIPSEEELKFALDNLDECVHRFCVFKESFRTYLIKSGIIKKDADKTG